MNVANSITVSRIVVAPMLALLPLLPSATARCSAFVLFAAAAGTDYLDGRVARSHNLVTDLGRLLDPLADKVLLTGTFVPMYILQRGPLIDAAPAGQDVTVGMRFVTPFGVAGLPLFVVMLVLGRELFMTVLRQRARRDGVVISAIGPAKWKTAFQLLWVGSAYCWFFALTLASQRGWLVDAGADSAMRNFALLNGIVGTLSMWVAVALTVYSLALYVRRYGVMLAPRRRGMAR